MIAQVQVVKELIMPTARLEHVNISVANAERTANFLEKLTGWHRRWEGPAANGGFTIHLGDETAYLAIYTNHSVHGAFSKGAPLNHIGIAVKNLNAAEAAVQAEGLTPFNRTEYKPGPRSFYFKDADGIEFEVVSYE
jgi:catechol 2,3-dioxygenase-like lactoylglutathione lyase family enzyme